MDSANHMSPNKRVMQHKMSIHVSHKEWIQQILIAERLKKNYSQAALMWSPFFIGTTFTTGGRLHVSLRYTFEFIVWKLGQRNHRVGRNIYWVQ